jgi:hypothetical protein
MRNTLESTLPWWIAGPLLTSGHGLTGAALLSPASIVSAGASPKRAPARLPRRSVPVASWRWRSLPACSSASSYSRGWCAPPSKRARAATLQFRWCKEPTCCDQLDVDSS